LSDLVLNPTFDPKDITEGKRRDLERSRWMRTIRIIWFMKFSRRISGKTIRWANRFWEPKETVRSFEQQKLFDFYRQRFSPNNMIISAAGNLNHQRFVQLI